MDMQMNGMETMGPVMMILVLLLGVLVIGGVVWLVWSVVRGRSASRSTSDDSPEGTLKKRYARGEIDRPTYERMLEDLGRGPEGG